MLTMGLMELTALIALVALLLVSSVGAIPVHRIFGSVVIALFGGVVALISSDHLGLSVSEVAGLAGFGLLGFVLPISFMRWAWKTMKQEASPTHPVAVQEMS